MVRLKNRYLLIQILSPSAPKTIASSPSEASTSTSALLLSPPSTLQHHLPTPDSVTHSTLVRLIRAQLALLFGDYGAGVAAAGLAIKYWSNATSTLILRCSRASVRIVWAAVTFVRSLAIADDSAGKNRGGLGRGAVAWGKDKEREVVLQVVKVSGTVKKCEEEAIRRARAICGRVRGLAVVKEAGMEIAVEKTAREEDDVLEQLEADIAMAEGFDEVDEDDSDDD